MIYGVQGVLYG